MKKVYRFGNVMLACATILCAGCNSQNDRQEEPKINCIEKNGNSKSQDGLTVFYITEVEQINYVVSITYTVSFTKETNDFSIKADRHDKNVDDALFVTFKEGELLSSKFVFSVTEYEVLHAGFSMLLSVGSYRYESLTVGNVEKYSDFNSEPHMSNNVLLSEYRLTSIELVNKVLQFALSFETKNNSVGLFFKAQ